MATKEYGIMDDCQGGYVCVTCRDDKTVTCDETIILDIVKKNDFPAELLSDSAKSAGYERKRFAETFVGKTAITTTMNVWRDVTNIYKKRILDRCLPK